MKAILIIKMPEGCNKCPLHYDYLHCIIAENMYAKLLEIKSLEEIREGYDYAIGHRPKLCPLKKLPDKYTGHEHDGWFMGYNDCLDDIMKVGDSNDD